MVRTWWQRWFPQPGKASKIGQTLAKSPRFRPCLELLENRLAPAALTLTVTTTQDETLNNFKLSLREAITQANNNPGPDTIILPAGVFKITRDPDSVLWDVTGDFNIKDSVTIKGAGAGVTIIDAQQKDRAFMVFGSSSTSPINVTFEGLTILNGYTTGYGGGIFYGNANLRVVDSVITANRAGGNGGGIANEEHAAAGSAKVIRSTVNRNVAALDGGGIYVTADSLGQGSKLTVKNSTIRRNFASDNGGGIFATTLTMTDSTVADNSCVDRGFNSIGGGIFATTATLSGSTVSGNSALQLGGGIRAITANLTSCTVSGNSSNASGGAMVVNRGTLRNCTITDNSGQEGGGVYSSASAPDTLLVVNTIIAGNLVRFGGSRPDVSGAFDSRGNNLIGDGTGSTGFGAAGDKVGDSLNPIDPKLGPLANNGGPTKTHALLAGSPAIDAGSNTPLAALTAAVDTTATTFFVSNASAFVAGMSLRLLNEVVIVVSVDASNNKLIVQRGSPATRAAYAVGTKMRLATDQRGSTRPKDGNGDGVAAADVGAFEF